MNDIDRETYLRRGKTLEHVTIAYNALEGLAALIAGAFAGSIALIGFGADSAIEVTSGVALLWRLHTDDPLTRERAERMTLRIVGFCFLALVAYVAIDSTRSLFKHQPPEHSIAGIIITSLSVIIMPMLAHAKRKVAAAIRSEALRAEARQTELCMYLSAITLAGLVLNAWLGWWWADPVAALVMVPIIANEGIEALRGKHCDDCSD